VDLNTGVTLLSQLAGEKFVQFRVENTVGHELATLGDSRRLSGTVDSWQKRSACSSHVGVITADIEKQV
jgi:hypothetical protein